MIPGLAQWVKDPVVQVADAALIRPLAWELPYAVGLVLKRKKKKKERKERERKKEAAVLLWGLMGEGQEARHFSSCCTYLPEEGDKMGVENQKAQTSSYKIHQGSSYCGSVG